MKWERVPHFLRDKIAPTWSREQAVKLFLKFPHKLQYFLARFGIRLVVNKKRAEMREFMRH